MIDVIISVLKVAWPFVLAVSIWSWQEVRIGALNLQLATSHKRESVVKSNLDAAQQRATDLALLYAGMLPKVTAAAKAQEEKDNVQIATLQQRVDQLSRAPSVPLSSFAVGLFDDLTTFANGGDAAVAKPVAEAVPEAARVFSERDIVEYDRDAAEAYRDAVGKLNECTNLYNAARNAQLTVSKP